MKTTRTLHAWACAAWLVGLAAPAQAQTAAATNDELLPLTYDASAIESGAVTVQTSTCPIQIVATDDQRQNKQTIGAKLSGPLLTGPASPWITDGLLNLSAHGFKVSRTESAAPPAEGVLVQTSLTRAYTWQVGLKIFSMVAVKARFLDKNGVLQDKYYRAYGDKSNMWGAAGEYVTTLNYGLNNMLRVMADDLSALCKGSKVETYTYAGPDPKPAAK
jgi:hypothetical protein